MKNIVKLLAVLTIFMLFTNVSNAQCKTFTKKNCLTVLEPYVFDGQLNTAILTEGDVAELLLTLYGGQNYRILVCGQDVLGKIEFNLYDTNRNLIYSNKDHDYINYWDFKSNSTQQLIVQVVIPKNDEVDDMMNNGCVSILKGFKEED
ncbi:MAG: hypothetical protein Kow0068_24990 [Marinilabiliales bacterium]